ncbi:MAG: Abortive infection protein [Acidimicrobiales bacterium]|nr:Abortive infection protein [Acidimicrobiales bacterium]
MTTVPSADVDAPVPPRWGMGDALAGWMIAVATASVLGAATVALAGYDTRDIEADRLPLWLTLIQSPFLWIGFIGVPLVVAATKGAGLRRDFDLRLTAVDVPIAAAVGVLAQLVLVPLVSLPFIWLSGVDADKLGEPAQNLADKVVGAPSIALLVVIVAIGAPLAEEIFFRGLVLRSIQKRFGVAWAVVGSSVAFGVTHLQPLQLPALAAAGACFALLAIRTGRLGPAIVAHIAFNATTVVNLIWIAR